MLKDEQVAVCKTVVRKDFVSSNLTPTTYVTTRMVPLWCHSSTGEP